MQTVSRLIMGMRCSLTTPESIDSLSADLFGFLSEIDTRFSPFKESSEVSQINRGEIEENEWSDEMREVLNLADETKRATDGYFDVYRNGVLDPSGLVKGWAISRGATMVRAAGVDNFMLEIAGDLEVAGEGPVGEGWTIGVRNPFNREEVVKRLRIWDKGVATSGDAVHQSHIYNPRDEKQQTEVAQVTVVGPTAYEADRFATAAYAMGRAGIDFIESRDGLEGYLIDRDGRATLTTGLKSYVA